MTVAVSVQDLVKRFPRASGYRQLLPGRRTEEITALAGVSLEISDGELFGLLGPNGAGKTTLMKILTTLVVPTSGRAAVYGVDVVSAGDDARRLVGLVTADERSFYWRLTGRQNLEFFAAIYQVPGRAAKRRVAELLDLVGLTDAADDRFQVYSTGMRQKMAIARGLLTDPRLLLVDEPTRSLDPLSAQAVRSALKQEVSRGRTVLLATHLMTEAEQLCDRVAILDRGRVLACGSVGSLRLSAGREQCHLELSGVVSDECLAVGRVPGVAALRVSAQRDGFIELEADLDDSRAVLPRLLEAIVRAGGQVHACEVRERSLEEIFIDVVGTSSIAAAATRSIQPGPAEAVSRC